MFQGGRGGRFVFMVWFVLIYVSVIHFSQSPKTRDYNTAMKMCSPHSRRYSPPCPFLISHHHHLLSHESGVTGSPSLNPDVDCL